MLFSRHEIGLTVLAAGKDGGALAGSLTATECDPGGRRR